MITHPVVNWEQYRLTVADYEEINAHDSESFTDAVFSILELPLHDGTIYLGDYDATDASDKHS